MEFKRDSVIALYFPGKSQVAAVRALQHLNVNKSFVSRIISHYRDTLGRQTFRPHSNMTQHSRTQLPHNGHQNLRISIHWTFKSGVYWKVRFSLKNIKVSIISRRLLARNGPKYRRASFVQPVMALSNV